MFSSVEVRWFGRGIPPADISGWFESCPGETEQQSRRRDYYLFPVDDLGLNIKLREGGLEIKQRQNTFGLVLLHPVLEGLVEGWIKWRFPLDSSHFPIQSVLAESNSWVAIEKERRLRRYDVKEAIVNPVEGPVTTAGCEVELTVIQSGDEQWWTVAFEATGGDRSALSRLLIVAKRLFAVTVPASLPIQDTFGYPHWLASSLYGA